MTGSQKVSRRQILTITAGAAGASVTAEVSVIGISMPARGGQGVATGCEVSGHSEGGATLQLRAV
jgi:hypothetical protein